MLGGVLMGKVTATGAAPLKEIKVLLLAKEDPSPKGMYEAREVVVWKRESSDGAAPVDVDEDFCIPLDAPLGATIPKFKMGSTGGDKEGEVAYSLRMHIEPCKGKAAWNSLPIRLVRTKLQGVAKGSTPVKPRKAPSVVGLLLLISILVFIASTVMYSFVAPDHFKGTITRVGDYAGIDTAFLTAPPPPPPPQGMAGGNSQYNMGEIDDEDEVYMNQGPVVAPTKEAMKQRLEKMPAWGMMKGRDEDYFDNMYEQLKKNPHMLDQIEMETKEMAGMQEEIQKMQKEHGLPAAGK